MSPRRRVFLPLICDATDAGSLPSRPLSRLGRRLRSSPSCRLVRQAARRVIPGKERGKECSEGRRSAARDVEEDDRPEDPPQEQEDVLSGDDDSRARAELLATLSPETGSLRRARSSSSFSTEPANPTFCRPCTTTANGTFTISRGSTTTGKTTTTGRGWSITSRWKNTTSGRRACTIT